MNDSSKARLLYSRMSVRKTFRVLLCAASVTATAIGCGWMGTSRSVRFNAYQSEREMGRLPPLPTMANGLNDARANWDDLDDGGDGDDAYILPRSDRKRSMRYGIEPRRWKRGRPARG